MLNAGSFLSDLGSGAINDLEVPGVVGSVSGLLCGGTSTSGCSTRSSSSVAFDEGWDCTGCCVSRRSSTTISSNITSLSSIVTCIDSSISGEGTSNTLGADVLIVIGLLETTGSQAGFKLLGGIRQSVCSRCKTGTGLACVLDLTEDHGLLLESILSILVCGVSGAV